jgi:hypothetical protein
MPVSDEKGRGGTSQEGNFIPQTTELSRNNDDHLQTGHIFWSLF